MTSQSRGAFAVNEELLQSRDYPPAFTCEPDRDERTFPSPWNVDQISQGYRVLDAKHRVLAYIVTGDQGTEDETGGLTLEEARRIARVIASLPDLIIKGPSGRTKRSWWTSIRRSG